MIAAEKPEFIFNDRSAYCKSAFDAAGFLAINPVAVKEKIVGVEFFVLGIDIRRAVE